MFVFNVIIKGTKPEAIEAAMKRGILVTELMQQEGLHTTGKIRSTIDIVSELNSWYCEDRSGSAPYPTGALLHWSLGQ